MKTVIIDKKDNVEILFEDFNGVKKGHKLALLDIKKGEKIIKYGHVIGVATKDIKKGEWVHTHNVKSTLDTESEYSYNFKPYTFTSKEGYFMGYNRNYGGAGIRNEIYIIPTVGCVNNVCKQLEEIGNTLKSGSIDGIYAFTHQFGCSQLGDDGENIKKLLSAIALNPNATYVIFVGLGCENNRLDLVKEYLAPFNRDNIFYFNSQDHNNEIEYGANILKTCIEKASKLKREKLPLSKLTIGLKCGGSDGFSGITANPTVGKMADSIVEFGGSAVLTEVPEMFGAEQILMDKCKDQETYLKYKKMIVDFKDFYKSNGFAVYENPSPGNKEGGITTLEEKSLGCVQKAGNSLINDVLDYGDIVTKKGVSVLNAPGNDLIAATALGASGCQMVLFTTGRGTPFSTFVPTLKISSNDSLAENKNNWIDFNAFNMDDKGLLELVIKTANGEYFAKSEKWREIAFFKKGVTL